MICIFPVASSSKDDPKNLIRRYEEIFALSMMSKCLCKCQKNRKCVVIQLLKIIANIKQTVTRFQFHLTWKLTLIWATNIIWTSKRLSKNLIISQISALFAGFHFLPIKKSHVFYIWSVLCNIFVTLKGRNTLQVHVSILLQKKNKWNVLVQTQSSQINFLQYSHRVRFHFTHDTVDCLFS